MNDIHLHRERVSAATGRVQTSTGPVATDSPIGALFAGGGIDEVVIRRHCGDEITYTRVMA